MLAANEAVGDSFQRRNEPVLWRIHDAPGRAKLETFAPAGRRATACPSTWTRRARPRGSASCWSGCKGHPAEKPLSFQLLRSLKQASYDMVNVGHFGLASQAYVHFTSPIRRYPDVVAHRRLKQRLALLGQAGRRFRPRRPTASDEPTAIWSGDGRRRVVVRRAQGDGDRARGDRPLPGLLHARPGGRRVRGDGLGGDLVRDLRGGGRALRRGAGAGRGAGRRHLQLRRVGPAPGGPALGPRRSPWATRSRWRCCRSAWPAGSIDFRLHGHRAEAPFRRRPRAGAPAPESQRRPQGRPQRTSARANASTDGRPTRKPPAPSAGSRAQPARARVAAVEAGAGGAAWLSRPPPDITPADFFETLAARCLRRRWRQAPPERPLVRVSLSGTEGGGMGAASRRRARLRVAQNPVGAPAPGRADRPDARTSVDAAERRRFPGGVGRRPGPARTVARRLGPLDMLFLDHARRGSAAARSTGGCWSSCRPPAAALGAGPGDGQGGLSAGRPRATVRVDAPPTKGCGTAAAAAAGAAGTQGRRRGRPRPGHAGADAAGQSPHPRLGPISDFAWLVAGGGPDLGAGVLLDERRARAATTPAMASTATVTIVRTLRRPASAG